MQFIISKLLATTNAQAHKKGPGRADSRVTPLLSAFWWCPGIQPASQPVGQSASQPASQPVDFAFIKFILWSSNRLPIYVPTNGGTATHPNSIQVSDKQLASFLLSCCDLLGPCRSW